MGKESVQSKNNREAEMEYLKEFTKQSCFDEELSRDQLRSLWTAYCLHQRLDADTSAYDNDLTELWRIIVKDPSKAIGWNGFDGFDNFMCRYLV